MKIPKRFKVGGQEIAVEQAGEGVVLGRCHLIDGKITIFNAYDGVGIKPSVRYNTFLHELTHAILETMGENELDQNERFVNTFASFLCEAMTTMEYDG